MKLPINKKMVMLPGIGIVVFGVSVMGMLFMKGSKTPSPDQTTQKATQDEKEDDDTTMKQTGTSTAVIATTNKDKKEKL